MLNLFADRVPAESSPRRENLAQVLRRTPVERRFLRAFRRNARFPTRDADGPLVALPGGMISLEPTDRFSKQGA
jgi:hypothetical protein